MQFAIIIGLGLLWSFSYYAQAMWQTCDLERLTNLNDTDDALVQFNLRVRKIKKATYGVTGSITFREQFSDDYDVEFLLYVSTKGNNQFVLSPFRIARRNLCSIVNKEFKTFLMEDLIKYTELPKPESKDDDLCAIYVKGKYEFKNLIFSADNLSKVFTTGLYKGVIMIYRKDDSVVNSGLEILGTLS